jgi:hypothetical protein
LTHEGFAVHREPVWRDRSNFIIQAPLPESDEPFRFEQLFVKKVTARTFEVCCIPFFIWDIALGDVVSTVDVADQKYLLDRVTERSGRFVFRVWFGDSFSPRKPVADRLTFLGALLEWSSSNLLAVDAANGIVATAIADYLQVCEDSGDLVYESGKR